jgi:hypothetical protein
MVSGLKADSYEEKLKEMELTNNIGGQMAPARHDPGLQDPHGKGHGAK